MLFFRTISLVAALAFATLSSAVPVGSADLALSGDVFARDVSELALPVKRGDDIPGLYDTCHQNVQGIIVKIHAAVAIGDYGSCVGYLDEISVQLNILIDGVRVYGSIQLSISVITSVIYALIEIIVDVLHILVNIDVEITARINIIGGLLGTLLQVTVDVVVDLNVSILVGILAPLRGIFVDLNILGIFVGIGIIL